MRPVREMLKVIFQNSTRGVLLATCARIKESRLVGRALAFPSVAQACSGGVRPGCFLTSREECSIQGTPVSAPAREVQSFNDTRQSCPGRWVCFCLQPKKIQYVGDQQEVLFS